ncbi:MAG: hypothetical protein OXN17_02595 [Candidatus Poribacteria bacterium]|nr:hypothetical protein [Candidatus Poribacteria bacterium]MDE0506237.1 hypothetical protein [Candidatus Poribacteria bacterium]
MNVDRTPKANPNKESVEVEHQTWLNLSIQGLEEAYGEDEPEYSSDFIEKVNPHYSGR